ncbi:hypothetical protein [Nitrospira sp. Ecomares 2.1]
MASYFFTRDTRRLLYSSEFDDLPEQLRIVAKVDELMAVCDQLEIQLTTTLATAAHLLSALIADLTASPETTKFLSRPRPAPVGGADQADFKLGHLPCHFTK